MNIIFTAIAGGRDRLKTQPTKAYCVAFTDDVLACDGWTVKPLLRTSENPVRRAKRVRVLASELNCTYSMWVDASIQFLTLDLDALVTRYLATTDIAALIHPRFTNVYQEADYCLLSGIEKQVDVTRGQLDRYRYEGLPEWEAYTPNVLANILRPIAVPSDRPVNHYQTGIIIRRHTPKIAEFEQLWWKEIEGGSARCQISFPYALWKLGVECTPIKDNLWFRIMPHERGPSTKRCIL